MKRALLVASCGVTLAAGACMLDLPEPTVRDDLGLDGSSGDASSTPDADASQDGGTGSDGGTDGGGGFDAAGCDASVCPFLMVSDPRLLDNDGTNLYFASGATVIQSANLTTSIVSTLSSKAGDAIVDLKVRSGFVYFVTLPGNNGNASRCPVSGCGGSRIDYLASAAPVGGVEADSSNVYFTMNKAQAQGGGLVKCGNGMPCASTTPFHALDTPTGLALSGARLFWYRSTQVGVFGCTLQGCSDETNTGSSGVVDVATDATNVYWVNGNDVSRAPKGQLSSAVAFVSNAYGGASGFAVRSDGQNVYWLTWNGQTQVGTLRRCGVASDCMSTPAETLATNLDRPKSLTITASAVYFATAGPGSGMIWRYTK